MSTLNLQVNAIAFADNVLSNNPMIRHFDISMKLLGMSAKNPDQRPYTIPAQSSQVVYDGTRTTSIDGTTQIDVSKPYLDKDVYRFTWDGTGTDPVFRTDRGVGITLSTSFTVTVNGPVATLTASAGPFVTTSIQVGDILNVMSGAGSSSTNQGRFVILAKTSNSISIQNIDAVAETFAVVDTSKVLIYSNGSSSNQIQIGDKVSINSGFSIATQGIYEVSEVTPTWFEIAVGAPAGIPIETDILPGASGVVFYKEAKKFLFIAAQQQIAVRLNAETSNNVLIDPVEAGNPEKAGIMIKNGSFYKLTLVNAALMEANVIVATVE